jgi:hypothetical protein
VELGYRPAGDRIIGHSRTARWTVGEGEAERTVFLYEFLLVAVWRTEADL